MRNVYEQPLRITRGVRLNKNEDTRSTDPEGVSQTDAPPLSTALVAGYGAASAPFEMLRAPALAILPALYAK